MQQNHYSVADNPFVSSLNNSVRRIGPVLRPPLLLINTSL